LRDDLADGHGTRCGVTGSVGGDALGLKAEEQTEIPIGESEDEPAIVKHAVVPGVRPDVAPASHYCSRCRTGPATARAFIRRAVSAYSSAAHPSFLPSALMSDLILSIARKRFETTRRLSASLEALKC